MQNFVFAEGSPPISLFQLPSYCGYSVRSSLRDLEMMVPYDACYITQEVQLLRYTSTWSYSCVLVVVTSPSLFMSEWQLCAAHVVVGKPTEALLPGADSLSCPVFLPLSLLLLLWHGSADGREGA